MTGALLPPSGQTEHPVCPRWPRTNRRELFNVPLWFPTGEPTEGHKCSSAHCDGPGRFPQRPTFHLRHRGRQRGRRFPHQRAGSSRGRGGAEKEKCGALLTSSAGESRQPSRNSRSNREGCIDLTSGRSELIYLRFRAHVCVSIGSMCSR